MQTTKDMHADVQNSDKHVGACTHAGMGHTNGVVDIRKGTDVDSDIHTEQELGELGHEEVGDEPAED